MMLKGYEREMLNDGNTYTFAHLALQLHKDICEKAEFNFNDAVNNYKARTDFNNGIYTLYGNNGVKYFFDNEMNFRGTKF